jgi:hypothetical protein
MNTIIESFNDTVLSLLTQLSQFIGISYLKQFKKIIKYNSILPIEQFLVNALPYRNQILERNELYFNNNDDYYNDVKNESSILIEILRLKDIYNNLDDNSKNNIWDFFQVMLHLGEEFIKIKMTHKLNKC